MNIARIELVTPKGLGRPQALWIDGQEMRGVRNVAVSYPVDGTRVVTVEFLAEFSEREPAPNEGRTWREIG